MLFTGAAVLICELEGRHNVDLALGLLGCVSGGGLNVWQVSAGFEGFEQIGGMISFGQRHGCQVCKNI